MAALPSKPPPGPAINVYVFIPPLIERTVITNVDEEDFSTWRWIHCLEIPTAKLQALNLSRYPFRWIRYSVGVILGSWGFLSTSEEVIQGVDYDQTMLPTTTLVLYYHTSNEERARMFPIDPNFDRTTLTSSTHTERYHPFVETVRKRDTSCIFTNAAAEYCDAAHIIAHSKGDQYINTFTERRSRDPEQRDVINSRSDVRNGLLMSPLLHRMLGDASIAILKTPNFAMKTTDVDPLAGPDEPRWSFHCFREGPQYTTFTFPRQCSKACLSGSASNTPPDILFEAIYAIAILSYFGVEQTENDISAVWNRDFYSGEPMSAQHIEQKQFTYDKEDGDRTKARHGKERNEREARRNPDMMDLVMVFSSLAAPPRQVQDAHERAVRKRAQDKVSSWLSTSSNQSGATAV
ncbi:hypothetical protein BDN70DRAFT_885678 [Pholiota conissans]|uniref:HNH nuclease domain-containing protein n=1 Tax=Pholiota conissans TaxID=109636 RepID=A0A9P5YR39_9AGAR|nr:hypothetical protein BDN70DRAFT_885678 [Pholiota conissans]